MVASHSSRLGTAARTWQGSVNAVAGIRTTMSVLNPVHPVTEPMSCARRAPATIRTRRIWGIRRLEIWLWGRLRSDETD